LLAHVSASLSRFDDRAPDGAVAVRAHVHMHMKGRLVITGTVKFYNSQRGYGFIQPDGGDKDVFVHASALERAGIDSLSEGQKVSFDTQTDPRSGKIAVSKLEVV
jgi:CspA family cold shock protein